MPAQHPFEPISWRPLACGTLVQDSQDSDARTCLAPPHDPVHLVEPAPAPTIEERVSAGYSDPRYGFHVTTSGETVDQHLHEALVASGVEPLPSAPSSPKPPRRPGRLRRAFAGLVDGFLYGLQVLWWNAEKIAIIVGIAVWCAYWGTATLYLIIDRGGF